MEPINGIQVGKCIRRLDQDVYLVYLTSNLDYAPMGYEVNAYRYLLKPVSEQDLLNVVVDVQEKLSKSARITVSTDVGTIILPLSSVYYIQACEHTSIVEAEGDSLVSNTSISEYEKQLSTFHFYRVHRKYLVNLNRIREFDYHHLTLDNGKTISISRRKSKDFQQTMECFVRGAL